MPAPRVGEATPAGSCDEVPIRTIAGHAPRALAIARGTSSGVWDPVARSERHGSACARCADGALSGVLSVYGRGYHTTEARIPRPLDYEGFASCLEKESVSRTRRSLAMDAGRELFGIYASLLLLYSWCSCSGMSRL